MHSDSKAVRIDLRDFRTAPMRAFHMTWFSFFLCFFGWFGIAPLMAVVRDELQLTKTQIGNTIIASVAVTVLARLLIGWLCDRIGPRRIYAVLLVGGAIPVAAIGLANSYETFLFARLCIGAVGASFVVTQHHTSLMFAPNVVGTANATTAGWGNMGGGATQIVTPLVLAGILALGVSPAMGWRLTMIVPAVLMVFAGIAYLRFTQDTPDGNFSGIHAPGSKDAPKPAGGGFLEAARDTRVWALFLIYGACFGVELTINNVAALYFHDHFSLDLATAGLIAGMFGLMNLFARTLGGFFGDRAGIRWGLRGRVGFLALVLAFEGVTLMLFSRMDLLPAAVVALVVFSLFVQMSEGATFSVVPMINKKAMGSVSGIVGAGGNAGAVAAGFLFRAEGIETQDAFLYLGMAVFVTSAATLLIRFTERQDVEARQEMQASLMARSGVMAAD